MDNGSTGLTYPFGTSIGKFYFELSKETYGNVENDRESKITCRRVSYFLARNSECFSVEVKGI